MPVDCNTIKNPLTSRLINGIEDWANNQETQDNVRAPYQAAISMFESRFNIPIEAAALLGKDQTRNFLSTGSIERFKLDLKEYVGRVKKGSLTGWEATEKFLTGTMLGKKDPVLAESLKEIRDIVNNNSLREQQTTSEFLSIIEDIKVSGGVEFGTFTDRKFNKALKEHRRLQLAHIKALDSTDNELRLKTEKELKDFERNGNVRSFVDFVKIIEKTMPAAIKLKYENEKKLADDGDKEAIDRVKRYDSGDLLVKISPKVDSDKEYLRQVGVDENLIRAVTKYNDLMNKSYSTLKLGIDKKIDTIIKKIENKQGSFDSVEKLQELKDNLKSKLMPKYKEDGYFPHFTNELNAKFMDKLMPYFDKMETSQIDGKHKSKDIDDIISELNVAIPSFAKARTQNTNYDYNRNFVDVISTYIQQVNKFNTNAFLTDSHLKSLDLARKMYGEPKDSQYSGKIVDTIESLYGSMNGDATVKGSMNEIKKALLSYQFINKLGFSPRSAARNYTQVLMNFVTFGSSNIIQSRKYLKQNALEFNLDEFLKDANLYMDTSEAAIESGINVKSANEIKIRRMNEKGEIIYSDEGSFAYKGLKVFSSGLSKIAQKSSWMHRTVENSNRKFTASIAFGQINKVMDESDRFERYLQKKIESGELKGTVASNKKRYAKAYAKNMVILNHFDYESYAKAKVMKEGVGQFLFQFQHYGMEFLERNYSVMREAKSDLKYAESFKDAKGVHKFMNMGFAYFLAPALISYISGYNQTLVEHTGKEILDDLSMILFSDLDNEEDREKINKQFFGKGIITSKLGPTVGTILDIGVMTELLNADNEYLDNLAFSIGESTSDSNMDISMQQLKMINQMLGRTVDRYIPMYSRGHLPDAIMQEVFTAYPKGKDPKTGEDQRTLIRDISPFIEKNYPQYFDKIKKKKKSKKRYKNLPLSLRNSLLYLEKEGKR